MRGIKWENLELEAVNELTEYLCFQRPELYHTIWNPLVIALKSAYTNPLIEKLMPELEARFGKDTENVQTALRWDILHILIGEYYKNVRALALYGDLLTVYRSGHLPVGWAGEYPAGELLVY